MTSAVQIVKADRAVSVTIDRPSVRNCIDEAVLDGLEEAVTLAEESRARVLVLRGAGGHFSAGMDLALVQSLLGDEPRLAHTIGRLVRVADRLERGPFASLAIVEGFALAGGFELLLSCDISIASSTARIGDCHLESGLIPGGGGAVRLPRSLPTARSNYLLLTGLTMTGREAAEWGVVSRCVEPDELESAATDLTERLASRSGAALRTSKQIALHSRASGVGAREAAHFEFERFLEHMSGADAREGIAAFGEKRRPLFDS